MLHVSGGCFHCYSDLIFVAYAYGELIVQMFGKLSLMVY